MNTSKFRLTLDLHSSVSQYSIPAKLGDTGVTWLINLTDGGIPYVISDGCLAKISIKRPTGTHLENFCAIKNNSVIEYRFEQDGSTCAEEGIHNCDVTIYDANEERIGSPSFTMVVSEMAVKSDDINLSANDYTVVNGMVAKEVERQNSEKLRVDAEEKRIIAEAKREAAEKLRVEAENNRVKGELSPGSVHFENLGNDVVLSLYRGEYGASMARFNDKRLTNIEKGYSDDYFIVDETASSLKLVPSNVAPYAEVKKIYGSTSAISGVRVANKPVRIEVCKTAEKTVLDATIDLSDMGDTMTVEKLNDGSFKFNGYTSEYGSDFARKFAVASLPSGTYSLSLRMISNSSGVMPKIYIYTSLGYEEVFFGTDKVIYGGQDLPLLINIDIGGGSVAEDLIISFEILKGTFSTSNNEFTADLTPISAMVIPEEVVAMRGYGCYGNYIDYENGIFHLAREIVDGTVVYIEPAEDIDIREHIGYDNLLVVEPNNYIRVIRADGTAGAHKTVIVYMKGAN